MREHFFFKSTRVTCFQSWNVEYLIHSIPGFDFFMQKAGIIHGRITPIELKMYKFSYFKSACATEWLAQQATNNGVAHLKPAGEIYTNLKAFHCTEPFIIPMLNRTEIHPPKTGLNEMIRSGPLISRVT